jgi:hypothetical protein
MRHGIIGRILKSRGLRLVEYTAPDIDEVAADIIVKTSEFTVTSQERVFQMIEAVRYVASARVEGSIVECGVWRGGSMMSAALTLLAGNLPKRDLHLFDTFEGMTEPSDADVSVKGARAIDRFKETARANGSNWQYASLEDVRANLLSTGYDPALMRFVKGRVEDTVPAQAPAQISILRLDTDWYESTLHELRHLYPRLARGGVLIIDDYGSWAGCRKAVDEYFREQNGPVFLARIDNSCRVVIKP